MLKSDKKPLTFKQPQHEFGPQYAPYRLIDVLHVHLACLDLAHEGLERVRSAAHLRVVILDSRLGSTLTGLQQRIGISRRRWGERGRNGRADAVESVEQVDAASIGDDVVLEVPLLTKLNTQDKHADISKCDTALRLCQETYDIRQKMRIRQCRDAIVRAIRTHEAQHARIDTTPLERGQVHAPELPLATRDGGEVEPVERRAEGRKVLALRSDTCECCAGGGPATAGLEASDVGVGHFASAVGEGVSICVMKS
jgi:hypothetical protein